MIEDTERFVKFLLDAKKATYASGMKESAEPTRPHSKDLGYEEGDFLYLDSYFGGFGFIGQEIVYEKGAPAWGMNYYGKTIHRDVSEMPVFLKECLKLVPEEAPFRGPERYVRDGFEYRCMYSGDIADFTGKEEIYLKDRLIYELHFHGGFVE